MPDTSEWISTGLPGLDQVLHGLRNGDNVVWQVDRMEQYAPFLKPFCAEARRRRAKLTYFRFARHHELLTENDRTTVVRLNPEVGFEKLLATILDTAEAAGPGACYVFDCLSDLAVDWYSDQMLGNFFRIVCPCLYRLDTIAYFAMFRNRHMGLATDAVTQTAQVVIDVYNHRQDLWVQPLKVFGRSAPTMYMLHHWDGDHFVPATASATVSEILAVLPQSWVAHKVRHVGVWARSYLHASEMLDAVRSGKLTFWEANDSFHRLARMALTRDPRFMALAEKYLNLEDLVNVLRRMVGTGLIGGKSLGMLLARAILKQASPRWAERLEMHDSFFIGADVFYTYLVQNDCWWLRRQMRDPRQYLEVVEETRRRMLNGRFPEHIQQEFMEMLNYFGQSPIIVRSSSLLEDNYGNAFSGKYESVFCPNQGAPEVRLEAFINAVRRVYASALGKDALEYRAHRGLLDQDEQMALLVQRVSGDIYGDCYLPQVAGTGFSFNPYVWDADIDPHAGFLRLVAGLGTRAVTRLDDDYTRLVALNAPERRLESSFEDVRRYSQQRVDVLDLANNRLASVRFEDLVKTAPQLPLPLLATRDEELLARAAEHHLDDVCPWVLTFDGLLNRSQFVVEMRELLQTLQAAYQNPVDIEFTVNFTHDTDYRLNLVQCRPFQVQVKGSGRIVRFPDVLADDDRVLSTRGPVIGQSAAMLVDRLIYVVPAAYSQLPMQKRYSVARIIGKLTRHSGAQPVPIMMLVGPGRWGTSSPSLGIPVSFGEIRNASVICEVAVMHEGLVPDVSLGTHFFNDLVELNMLYLGVMPTREGAAVNEQFFTRLPNRLATLLPEAVEFAPVIKVIEAPDVPGDRTICLNADVLQQRALCYLAPRE